MLWTWPGIIIITGRPLPELSMNTRSRFSRLIFPMLLLGLAACSTSPEQESTPNFVKTEDTPEAEARAAFVNLASVSHRKDIDAFRPLIYAADLPDMEAEERQHPGHYEALMASIAAHKPKDFRLDLIGSTATFTWDTDPGADARVVVVLVRDGVLWKMAKPKNEDDSSRSPVPEETSREGVHSRKTRKHSHGR